MKARDRARLRWGDPPPAPPRYVRATPQEQGLCRAYPDPLEPRDVRCRCGAGPWSSIVDFERHERGLS